MLPSAALTSPRGRMDVRMGGPPIVRWMAAKGQPAPANDLRTSVVSGVFWSTRVLGANWMSSRFNRGASASALTVRDQSFDSVC